MLFTYLTIIFLIRAASLFFFLRLNASSWFRPWNQQGELEGVIEYQDISPGGDL